MFISYLRSNIYSMNIDYRTLLSKSKNLHKVFDKNYFLGQNNDATQLFDAGACIMRSSFAYRTLIPFIVITFPLLGSGSYISSLTRIS